jgi:hypothetical protein
VGVRDGRHCSKPGLLTDGHHQPFRSHRNEDPTIVAKESGSMSQM